MRSELLAHLRPEFTAQFDRFLENNGDVEEGVLRGPTGAWWPVVRGVPCFLTGQLRPDLCDRNFAPDLCLFRRPVLEGRPLRIQLHVLGGALGLALLGQPARHGRLGRNRRHYLRRASGDPDPRNGKGRTRRRGPIRNALKG